MESQKKKRYDRQLRMWGEHGQDALERCKLCLLNGSATGSEALKNLVLPGIGSFTVVDGARVSASDLGNNFFLDQSHLGRPRAECVTALLQELNEHVRGSYVVEDVASLLATNPGFLDDFTFVIATQLPEPALCALAAACVERSLPLIALRAYGMVGTVRVAAGEHVLVEGHPDNTPTDLRVCAPFAELRAYAAAKFGHDLGALSSSERKHVPFLILLLHATERYKGAHGGSLPASYKDKQALKASLGALAEEWFGAAGAHNALNFEEARLAVNTALQLPQLPAETRKVLEAAEGKLRALRPAPPPDAVPSPKPRDFAAHRSRTFWILAAALRRFVNGEGAGALPVLGSLPDMTADTTSYVELVNLYRARARADAALVHAHAQAVALSCGLGEDAVGIEQTRLFCKNAHSLQWLHFRALEEELAPQTARAAQLGALLDDGSEAPAAALYLLLRAADAFHAQYNRFPGTMDDDVESDVPLLKQCVTALLSELKTQAGSAPLSIRDDLIFEMCRYGASELHTVAAIVGGVGAQELIKLVTAQFVPMNNTYIYNGINGTGLVVEL